MSKRPDHRSRNQWQVMEFAARKARRRAMLRHYGVLYLCWAGMVLCAIWETVACWLAVQALDSAWPLVPAAAMWAATLCVVVPDVLRHWRQRMAMRLYYEDIADGTCPDRGMQIRPENAWKWYRKHGSPLWVSAKRTRPKVHPGDAIARLQGRNPPPRPPQAS